MLGIDINILLHALFTLFGMAGSIGVVLFIGGRWTARIEEKLRAMDRRFDYVDRRFEDMDRRMTEGFAAVHQRFEDMDRRMTEGFAAVNHRIDSLETRITSLEERVSHLEERVGHLDVRMGEIPEVTIDRLMKLFQLREAVIATTTEASKNAG